MIRKLSSIILTIGLVALGWIYFNKSQPLSLQENQTNQVTPKVASEASILGTTSSQCVSKDGLPDPICTPGAVSETDTYTVCHRSTKTIRPPLSFTDSLKAEQIQQYGYSDTNLKDYEEDHLISLELGGSPTDPKNLWPEPRNTISSPGQSAQDKDKIENLCHERVCSGEIPISEAQKQIAANWETACQ